MIWESIWMIRNHQRDRKWVICKSLLGEMQTYSHGFCLEVNVKEAYQMNKYYQQCHAWMQNLEETSAIRKSFYSKALWELSRWRIFVLSSGVLPWRWSLSSHLKSLTIHWRGSSFLNFLNCNCDQASSWKWVCFLRSQTWKCFDRPWRKFLTCRLWTYKKNLKRSELKWYDLLWVARIFISWDASLGKLRARNGFLLFRSSFVRVCCRLSSILFWRSKLNV